MTYTVGTKGQVVIEKRIRDRLGVASGWRALQAVVDDHVEIRFVPPAHDRSLAGSLRKYVKRSLPDADSFRAAREAAWRKVADERVAQMRRDARTGGAES